MEYNNPFELKHTDNNVADDIFGMSLDYYTGDYMNADVNLVNTTHTGVQDFYNGTIKAQNWLTENHPLELNTAASQKVSSYVYQYDNKYQLTAGLFGKRNSATTSTFSGAVNNALSTQSLSYDQNGNMLGLTRKDKEGVMMHDFVNKFHYETPVSNTTKGKFTNQLDKVDGYADYTYDELGQLSEVSYTGGETMKLTYNPAGLVEKITDVNNVTKVAYEYDDMGQRIIKRNVTAGGTTEDWYIRDGNGTVVSIYRKEVDGSVNQIEIPVYGAGRLGQCQLGTADKIVYELKDHLGNVRAVLNRTLKNTNEVDLLSTMNYFPYGLKHGTIGEQYRYGYQGDFAEDETDETGFNSFELRQYDPVIGRWISVDPERQYASPYVGMRNDPIGRIDSDGGLDDIYYETSSPNSIDIVKTNNPDRYFIDNKQVDADVIVPNGSWSVGEFNKMGISDVNIYNGYFDYRTSVVGDKVLDFESSLNESIESVLHKDLKLSEDYTWEGQSNGDFGEGNKGMKLLVGTVVVEVTAAAGGAYVLANGGMSYVIIQTQQGIHYVATSSVGVKTIDYVTTKLPNTLRGFSEKDGGRTWNTILTAPQKVKQSYEQYKWW